MIQEQVQSPRSSHCLAIIVLLIILVFAVLYAIAQFGASVGTQTSNQNQCLNNGQSFNNKQEAFTLAQTAEQYRAAHPFGGNYGPGSYTICYKNGAASRQQSEVFRGFSSGKPPNSTHSEQFVYTWLKDSLAALSIDQSQVAAIYVVIFSQVKVCPLCQQIDMPLWQRTLRQKAKTERVSLSVWQLIPGKGGFNPALYKAGTGIPVTIAMIQEVEIKFVP